MSKFRDRAQSARRHLAAGLQASRASILRVPGYSAEPSRPGFWALGLGFKVLGFRVSGFRAGGGVGIQGAGQEESE